MNKSVLRLFFAVLLVGYAFVDSSAQVIDKIIAKVDNHIVLESELDFAYQQYLQNQEGAAPTDIKCRVLETLMVNKLMLAKAEIDSIVVEKSQVDDQLERRMQYFISQVGSAEKFTERYGKTIDELKSELRKQVKEQMVIQKMQDNITAKIKVTPGDTKKFYGDIPKDSLPYFSTEVEIAQLMKNAFISKDQKNQAKLKLEKIRLRLINGEDFCELAKQYSEDPGSAKLCGELGFFKKGDLVPPYESAALKLKPGETSAIIESEFGFHMIQLIERRGTEYNSRHILIKATSSRKDLGATERYLDSLRRKILSDSISFEKAAKEYSDDKTTSANGGLFQDQNTGDTRIPLESLDPGLFFIIDTMKVGTVTKPIPVRLEDGTEALRMIYYKSKTPPHQANLKDDYQKIYKAAIEEKKNNAINEWFDKTKGEVFIDVHSDYKDCKLLTQ